ncbi:hypothetical protein DESUT3_37030 [Desulfuromonas versatilis]|uniref:Flagellar FliJ protein n=1 Tax=Desulfuromonas versatilis TaxID=2802975 RepID=A0ABM8HXE5_9BACT|nr:flagellar export protein FliJ [Desulfuromonas versatilis]BCR06634.1 hypothetical protein DESUT3_37030 [Desulfuromonas versatilis]
MSKQFKLQSVLDYRSLREDLARQQLAAAQQREADLLTRLVREQEALEHLQADFDTRQRQGMAPHEFALHSDHISHKVKVVAAALEEWEAAGEEVAERRRALGEASQEKKLLEKVKERQLSEFEAEQRRREMAFLDEIAVQHYKR